MPQFVEGSVSVLTQGHYRIRIPDGEGPHPLLVGFHGYAQNAEEHLTDLSQIPDTEAWAICAAQALHPFYRRKDRVVGASWMTRFGRDLAIVDNQAYIHRLVATLRNQYRLDGPLVYAGFSQGVAMAYRAAVGSGHRSDGLIILAGDVPPELGSSGLSPLGPILLGAGTQDAFYGPAQAEEDRVRLTEASVTVEDCIFEGGHEWHPEFLRSASCFLSRVREGWHPIRRRSRVLSPPITDEDLPSSDTPKDPTTE